MAEVTIPIITDDTGQSIASAISGLGATLGSDKANISGDNIANPSAFRQNIGAQATTSGTAGVCVSVNASLGFGEKNALILNNRMVCGTVEFYTTASISTGADLFDLPKETAVALILQFRADTGGIYIAKVEANSKRVKSYSVALPRDNFRGSYCYISA